MKVDRQPDQTLVLVTGVFDIVHSEHLKFLRAARQKGQILIVGLETDQRVLRLKGPGRPVNRLGKRLSNLAKTAIPDYVFPLPIQFDTTLDHQALLAVLRPDILAVSSHTLHLDKKKRLMAKYSGQLKVVLPYNAEVSTTKILKEVGF
jgi:D-beta-D-heptose 7-phosphate kinase/D-beta-D-heptose 1-phosphate adenosyltransferase